MTHLDIVVLYYFVCMFFFFQAEDGIRDDLVTGVQTCALPICLGLLRATWGNVNFYDGVTNSIINLKGLSAPNAPEYQATLAADWRHDLAQGYVLGARIDARFTGRSWWDPQNYNQQRSYQIANAGTWLEIGEHWRVLGHGNNIFDRRYHNDFY